MEEDSQGLAATYSFILPIGGFSGTAGVYLGREGPTERGNPNRYLRVHDGVYGNIEVGYGMLVGGGGQYEFALGPETNSLEGGTINYTGCVGVCVTLSWSEDASFPSWPTGAVIGGPGGGFAVTFGEPATAEVTIGEPGLPYDQWRDQQFPDLGSGSSLGPVDFGSGDLGGGASGGFVLYPSRPNLNMAARTYAK